MNSAELLVAIVGCSCLATTMPGWGCPLPVMDSTSPCTPLFSLNAESKILFQCDTGNAQPGHSRTGFRRSSCRKAAAVVGHINEEEVCNWTPGKMSRNEQGSVYAPSSQIAP